MIDDELKQALQRGDETAYKSLFDSHYEQLVDYAWRIVRDKAVAKDVVQTVFCTLYDQRRHIVISQSVKAYLYKSVYNRSLNHLRQQRKFLPNQADEQTLNFYFQKIIQPPEAELAIDYAEVSRFVNEAISSLPERCREVFLLKRQQGLSHQEIAQRLGISTKTVEAQMTKALSRLRAELEWLLVWCTYICNAQ